MLTCSSKDYLDMNVHVVNVHSIADQNRSAFCLMAAFVFCLQGGFFVRQREWQAAAIHQGKILEKDSMVS